MFCGMVPWPLPVPEAEVRLRDALKVGYEKCKLEPFLVKEDSGS
jgi:hypothetical protein